MPFQLSFRITILAILIQYFSLEISGLTWDHNWVITKPYQTKLGLLRSYFRCFGPIFWLNLIFSHFLRFCHPIPIPHWSEEYRNTCPTNWNFFFAWECFKSKIYPRLLAFTLVLKHYQAKKSFSSWDRCSCIPQTILVLGWGIKTWENGKGLERLDLAWYGLVMTQIRSYDKPNKSKSLIFVKAISVEFQDHYLG